MDIFERWDFLKSELLHLSDVAEGKMMSAPAVTFGGKVFAFYSTKGGREGLGLRLGRDTDFASLALSDWQHLAPFNTKPPMKDWIVVGAADQARWSQLAHLAYEKAKGNANV